MVGFMWGFCTGSLRVVQGLPGAGEILRQGLPRDQQDSNPEGSWMVGRKVEC